MYSCGDIVYGYDLSLNGRVNEQISNEDIQDILDEIQAAEPEGYLSPYSGSSSPYAFGVILDGFDVCSNVLLSSLKMKVTEQHKNDFNHLLEDLDEELRSKLKKLGEPDVFILWSTS